MSFLDIYLLGEFRIRYNGEAVATIHQPRQQSLVAYLVLHCRAPQLRRQIAFTLWPDTPETQAYTNLRRELHQLRRTLPQADRLLQIDAHTLGWSNDVPFDLDVATFEDHIAQARAAGQTACAADELAWLERAVESYTGDLVPGCYDDWIRNDRERLRQTFLQALGRAIDLLEAQATCHDPINLARPWLALIADGDPVKGWTHAATLKLRNSSKATMRPINQKFLI